MLARDRLGKKPLYYTIDGGVLSFGSELKALRAHPDFHAQIDRGALALYVRYTCIPAPYSIYEGVRKLPPATVLTLGPGAYTVVVKAAAEEDAGEVLAEVYLVP